MIQEYRMINEVNKTIERHLDSFYLAAFLLEKIGALAHTFSQFSRDFKKPTLQWHYENVKQAV